MKMHWVWAGLILLFSSSWAGKQRIIIKLRDPLKAEAIKVRLPEITNAKGETRDLETKLELGTETKVEVSKIQSVTLSLNMVLHNIGNNGVQVTLTLPDAGFIEVEVMDFYGKTLASLFSGNLPSGNHPLDPYILKDTDNNAIKFITLRINGKVALKKVLTKVR
jgi:hypothetical protein